MGTRGVGRICSRLTILLTVRVPGVFEKTESKNSKQRDSACPNRLRRETSGAIFLFFSTQNLSSAIALLGT